MSTPPKAYPLALRWLTLRSRSEADLRQRLQQKGCEHDDIEHAVQRCLELGYLNDKNFALERASQLMRRGRAVGVRLKHELKKIGINDHHALHAIEQCQYEHDEEQILADLVHRRYARVDFTNLDQREQRRIVNYLQRRGFSLGLILDHLKKKKDTSC